MLLNYNQPATLNLQPAASTLRCVITQPALSSSDLASLYHCNIWSPASVYIRLISTYFAHPLLASFLLSPPAMFAPLTAAGFYTASLNYCYLCPPASLNHHQPALLNQQPPASTKLHSIHTTNACQLLPSFAQSPPAISARSSAASYYPASLNQCHLRLPAHI